MPYVSVLTNVPVSLEKEELLVKVLGEGIEVITDKVKENLFINIDASCRLYKGGDINIPNAMVSVDLYGHSTSEDLKKYSDIIFTVLENELSIKPESVFINYTECRHWGSRGNTNTAFDV